MALPIDVQNDMKQELEQLRFDLQSLESMEKQGANTVELDQARVGRLSRMDALQGQAMSQETARRRQLLIRDIGVALSKIDDGMFGECGECEEDINIERLRVNPAAGLCITCASLAEQI